MRAVKGRARKRKSGPRSKDIATARELRRIRVAHNWSQEQLALRLGVRQPLISAWERGYLPSPRMYFKFSRLPLDYASQRWLVEKAGADLKTLETIADGLRKQRHGRPPSDEIVHILPMPKIEGEGPDLIISAPKLPHPYLTQYVHVRVNFMKPQFGPGDILMVDVSETDPWELEEGSCVAVYRSPEYAEQQHWAERRKEIEESHPKEELDERRRTMSYPYQPIGLFVGWLRKQIETDAEGNHGMFFLEAPWIREIFSVRQPHHPADAQHFDASGRIVLGRVVAWLHRDLDQGSEQQRKATASAPSAELNTRKEKRK